MLDHLQIDQAKGKNAEERNEGEANERTSTPAIPFHRPAR
jgi:hypothetical protein